MPTRSESGRETNWLKLLTRREILTRLSLVSLSRPTLFWSCVSRGVPRFPKGTKAQVPRRGLRYSFAFHGLRL